jgi:hypothetical protein
MKIHWSLCQQDDSIKSIQKKIEADIPALLSKQMTMEQMCTKHNLSIITGQGYIDLDRGVSSFANVSFCIVQGMSEWFIMTSIEGIDY